MHVRFESQSDLDDAMLMLVKQDPRLKPILAQTGMPALRQREPIHWTTKRSARRAPTGSGGSACPQPRSIRSSSLRRNSRPTG
jgi:hypothetical protein